MSSSKLNGNRTVKVGVGFDKLTVLVDSMLDPLTCLLHDFMVALTETWLKPSSTRYS